MVSSLGGLRHNGREFEGRREEGREPGFRGQRARKVNILNLKKLIMLLREEEGQVNPEEGFRSWWVNQRRDL